MSIKAADVNNLRKQTGAGMMDCKDALNQSNGDFEAAIDYLRKKGQKIATKRADREAKEGVVIAKSNDNNTKGIIVYLSCETDFVAKNDDFVNFTKSIADVVLKQPPDQLDGVLDLTLDGNTIREKISDNIGKIGEKIELKRYEKLEADAVISYVHAGNKIGVLVGMNKKKTEAIEIVAKDIAMQIAAMAPIAIDEDDVDQSIVDRELKIGRELAIEEGKPENIVDKIATGKLQKFYKENTLLNQQFVKDNNITIRQLLKDIDPDLKVTQFFRVQLGV